MKKCLTMVAFGAVLSLLVLGCGGQSDSNKPAEAAKPAEATKAEPVAPSAATATANTEKGMVKEAMDADGKTYLHIEVAPGQSAWYAAPQSAINVGEVVAVKNPVMKSNYKSEELKREFETIYFVEAVKPLSAMSQAAPAGQSAQNPHGNTAPAPTNVDLKGIAKLSGGYTVGELYSKKNQLADKEVSLRAKVVKFSGGIMGTNWMHLRDGTGDDKSNDLTITSDNQAKVGDTVVVKGILKKDIDIGSGYFFPLIIQKAEVKAQ